MCTSVRVRFGVIIKPKNDENQFNVETYVFRLILQQFLPGSTSHRRLQKPVYSNT